MGEIINCFCCGKEFTKGEYGSDWKYCPDCTRARNRERYHARMERNKKEPDPYVNCSICGTKYLRGIKGSEGLHCPGCTRERNRSRYITPKKRKESGQYRKCSICGQTFVYGETGSCNGRCPQCINDYARERLVNNREEINDRQRKRYEVNKDKINKERNEEYHRNPEKIKEKSRYYYYEHKPQIRERKREYTRLRAENDIEYRLQRSLRSRIRCAIKNQSTVKSGKTVELLGCSVAEARRHIESLWKPGMSWDNWGNGHGKWNIDHSRPIASFILSDPEQQKEAFNWRNMAPLWYEDNMKKLDRLPDGTLGRYLNKKTGCN